MHEPSRLRTDIDPGACGGLVPQKNPDKEGQQETEDPIPVEQIQDETENNQDPNNEEDDVEHGGRPSPNRGCADHLAVISS